MGTYRWTRGFEYELAMDRDTIDDFVLVGFLLETIVLTRMIEGI